VMAVLLVCGAGSTGVSPTPRLCLS